MDTNGYNPSIVEEQSGVRCWYCKRIGGDLVRHEVFHNTLGGMRDKCKRAGLWVTLCPRCHDAIHSRSNPDIEEMLKPISEAKALENGWTLEEFILSFGRNYL